MGKEKRNRIQNISIRQSYLSSKGYIETYLKEEVSTLLTADQSYYQNLSSEPYVPHEDAEKEIRRYLIPDFDTDKCMVFSGLTGSGKSTIIRHVLEIKGNRIEISGATLIIPIDFNRKHLSAEIAFTSNLQAAVKYLVEKYNIDFPDIDNISFCNYVREKKRNELMFLDVRLPGKATDTDRMKAFIENMPLTFCSCQLQYVLDHEESKINLVVLVVDNIEGYVAKCDENETLAPIIETLELADCIHDRGKETKWCFNTIIVCRHHIWRIMGGAYYKNKKVTTLLKSYAETECYDLKNPVKIQDIIAKRKEVLAPSQERKNPQKWKRAVAVVESILERMENKIGDFILQLNLKDIRQSLNTLKALSFCSRLQKQSNEYINGAFQIDSIEQFDLSVVNLVRAIGIGDSEYYNEESLIPNLLWNQRREGTELYLLLTLRYFLLKSGEQEPDWNNYVSIENFYNLMKQIFDYDDTAAKAIFSKVIQRLFEYRLLLRSADQPQTDIPGLTACEIEKIEKCYVSGAAVILWKHMSESSVLFQLFMDDIWLDEDASYFGNDIEHCVEYLKYLISQETKIYNHAKNNGQENLFLDVFGTRPICDFMVRGLIRSLETIVNSQSISSEDNDRQKRLQVAIGTLNEARNLRYLIQKIYA